MAELPPISVNEVRLWLSVLADNPGEPLAAVGIGAQDCQLVVDEPAAAVGENRLSTGETHLVLLAAGREPSNAATLRAHGRADRVAALARG